MNTDKNPQPIAKIIPLVMTEISACQEMPLPPDEPSQIKLPVITPCVLRPCKTAWQRKWLQLDISHPKLQLAADDAESLLARWFRHAPGPNKLVLVGPNGCGKTHIAKALFNASQRLAFTALERYWGTLSLTSVPSVSFFPWPMLVDQLERVDASIESTLRDAREATFLVLDEAGGESDRFRSGKSVDALAQLLNQRERNCWTVLTSNVMPADWGTKWDRRIADRLMRNSVVVDLSDVPSYSLTS